VKPSPRLRLEGISKSFGATQALRSVSLEVGAGEVHALIGENGAGKSTLLKILSGAHGSDAGAMELEGRPYRPSGPLDARRSGVAMIYQEVNLALHLSVQENILLGSESSRLGWIDAAQSRRRAHESLAALGYSHILSIIYVSHFLEECRRACDRYTVLKDGETVGSGAMAEAGMDTLVALMTGRPVADLYPRAARKAGSPALEVRAVASAPRLRSASFQLREGEILGLAGLVGAGRTDLVRAVFGLDRADSGEVAVFGRTGDPSPRRSWSEGLGFLSENRKEEGLMLGQPIADNITMTKLGEFSRMGWISADRQEAAALRWTAELAVKCRDAHQPVGELSGGNQQKVALARLLEHPARILLLDEPTRGIDVGSKAQV
jgi:ribose transport system ATP-binding protein